jgi:transcriptional regulator with XRE-family HTH domain
MVSAHNSSTTLRFGRAVREMRDALNISQEELAARSGLHRTYVAGVERGIRNPSLKSIVRIAEGLGTTVSRLFEHVESGSSRKSSGRKKR